MCLDTVRVIHKYNRRKILGWKIVKLAGDGKYTPMFQCNHTLFMKKGEWYTRSRHGNRKKVMLGDGNWYPGGFHIFRDREDAIRYGRYTTFGRLVKVEGQGLLAEGAQSIGISSTLRLIYICRRQRILEVIDGEVINLCA